MNEGKEKMTDLIDRPPVVVILGHIDHGKTKILDYLRQTKITEGEAGGITQHIGAYQVDFKGKSITFLDTPGHEAFSAIRSRGAKIADVAVLVVAADEGVKPQTKDAIGVVKEAQIPVVVAINKIDKSNANVQKVKQELADNEILVEDWGGKIPSVEVSAKTGQGIDQLLEIILLVAEMEELKAETEKTDGVVIDVRLDNRRGHLATLLVQNGCLKVGDWLVAGQQAIKIKLLENFLGQSINFAYPSQPAVALGWTTSPLLGEKFVVVASRQEAWQLARAAPVLNQTEVFQSEQTEIASAGVKKFFNLIVKADVFSSLEAIDQVLKTIQSEEVKYRVVDFGLGNISDGDIKKAVSFGATVVGFHVGTTDVLKLMAGREKVEIATFEIIYELLEYIKKRMSELLEPEIKRIVHGRLKVLALFKKEAKSQIVGGKVILGKIKRGLLVEVLRQDKVIVTGKLGQLQRQKVDTEEAIEGQEAGLRIDFVAKSLLPNLYLREGDILEAYEEEKIKRNV